MSEQQTARTARVQRSTGETQIELSLNIDGSGQSTIDTGVGFLDHDAGTVGAARAV